MLYATNVSTVAEWDSIVESHCLPVGTSEVCGVPISSRFEELPATLIKSLSDWYEQNGTTVLVTLNEELALHILGATEVDPSKDRWNYKRGTGKDAVHYWCSNNEHNRVSAASAIGDPNRDGLAYDMAHDFFAVGPTATVDCVGAIVSFSHRCKAYLLCIDSGFNPTVKVLVNVGVPPQLVAIFDRNKPKTGADQEHMDRTQFPFEYLVSILDDEMPDNTEKLRKDLTANLVTIRNNLWSRFQGTGYHPSKRQQPTVRQALALVKQFEPSDIDSTQTQLHDLIVRVWAESISEDGKKQLWATRGITVPMVVTAIVLASNTDSEPYDSESTIKVDSNVADSVLEALGLCSDKGDEGLSSFLREVATIKRQAKKPSGFDRWLFWGFVSALSDTLDGTYDAAKAYFPSVTNKLQKQVKDGKVAEPVFGGLDAGPRETETDDND